ncbi:AAA family ATPase [Candidatus Nitrospira bockiana]
MASPLERVTIQGFTSIRELKDFPLTKLNILVGANGAGKSNFVDLFRSLRAMAEEGLSTFVLEHGRADAFLFNGPKVTHYIICHLAFGYNEYRFRLKPAVTGELIVDSEEVLYTGGGGWELKTAGKPESGLKTWRDEKSRWGSYYGPAHYVSESVSSWIVYHFHDTSLTSAMRRDHSIRDWRGLRPDAGNIAAFLYRLKQTHRDVYEEVRYHIRLIAPYFDDFLLEPQQSGPEELIRLEWQQKGSPTPLQPHQFSDGTIRFICLATALLQPVPPATIVIDEPELGLHPFALSVLASLLRQRSQKTQIVVSTQSAPLLDYFEPEEIVVVNRAGGASDFQRLTADSLKEWLEEYTLSQLWQKNVFQAGPVHE